MKLNKDITSVMKGYGILFIALHNLLHLGNLTEFVKENENTFDVQRTWDYFEVLKSFEWSDIGQFFSFLGWIGVSAFLFISGFGLVNKYENSSKTIKVGEYIYYSWKKLAFLLIPGALFFVLLSFVDGNWTTVLPKSILQLTLLNNFFIPLITFNPGVYWYFGLTFELYLLYVIVRNWNVKKLLVIWAGVLVIQIVVVYAWGPTSDVWSWVRHNFLGWGHVFIAGMVVAKTGVDRYLPNNAVLLFVFAIVSLILIPIMSLNVWLWLLFVPYLALLFFVFLCCSFVKLRFLKTMGTWLGKYSAFIFVTHPIMRYLVIRINAMVELGIGLVTIIYIVMFLIGAIICKSIFDWMMGISSRNKIKFE